MTLDLDAVASQLRGRRLRGPLIYRSRTGSTNDDARGMAEAGAGEGAVVIAGEQLQGRGRHGRAWFGDPDNSLQFSILLRPPLPPEQFPRLVNTIGVAVAEGCADAIRCDVGTKWPNDLILRGRKVGGILLEANAPQYAVAGIGLNVLGDDGQFPADLQGSATCLQAALTGDLSREAVLAAVLNALDRWYETLLNGRWDKVLAHQRTMETTLGQEHTVRVGEEAVHGRVLDLSPEGGLLVETEHGARVVTVGEIM